MKSAQIRGFSQVLWAWLGAIFVNAISMSLRIVLIEIFKRIQLKTTRTQSNQIIDEKRMRMEYFNHSQLSYNEWLCVYCSRLSKNVIIPERAECQINFCQANNCDKWLPYSMLGIIIFTISVWCNPHSLLCAFS